MNEVNTSGRIRMEPNPHLSQKTHTIYGVHKPSRSSVRLLRGDMKVTTRRTKKLNALKRLPMRGRPGGQGTLTLQYGPKVLIHAHVSL